MKNEPAFPAEEDTEYPSAVVTTKHQGMTLRDYFAAKAMQGLLLDDNGDFSDPNWMAETAYAYADAMLKERQ